MCLFEEMAKIVERKLSAYKDDFYVHDVNRITKEAKIGKTFYWLVRSHGTSLTTKDRMLIDSKSWSEYPIFEYHADSTECIVYEVTITGKTGDTLEGKLKKIKIADLLSEYKEKAVPKLVTIHTPKGDYARPWNEEVEFEAPLDFVAKQQQVDVNSLSMSDIYMTFTFK